LVFDGDCNFCRVWIRRWEQTTGDRIEYLPFQDPAIMARFPEIPLEQLERAVHFIQTDGSVFNGAEAAFRALASNPQEQFFLDWYEHSPIFARVTERGYRFVAEHRKFFSFLTRLAWGEQVQAPSYLLVRRTFLAALAAIYLIAFASLWVQVTGLIGSNGIVPVKLTMEEAKKEVAAANLGVARYHLVPTLCWFSASDRFLSLQCGAGVVISILLLAGIAPAPCLFLLWLLYLSLSTVGREFLSFQWDTLLLETGFLAIFLAPLQLWWRAGKVAPPSRTVLWLLRWLLFRLMFESGWVKLLSHDPTWRDFTALAFHYETQPLPTWLGWYIHQLPLSAHKVSTLIMFVIELALPFLIFAPRRFRHFACIGFILLQIAILLTGNYCFFNLLTIALSLCLLDDNALRAVFRRKPPNSPSIPTKSSQAPWRKWPRAVTLPLACIIGIISMIQFTMILRVQFPWPRPLLAVYQWVAPFRSLNTYGLFAVMTTSRPEIIIQGSNDGTEWLEYEFKYKAGLLKRRPQFVEPHQPRLDWQMWFAALGTYRQNPWLLNFCLRLLQGSPQVIGLLAHNPFPGAPPRYIRAIVYDYHFTDFSTRRATDQWWRRENAREYLPAMSLRE
jgi:predicted DCC family thiol-disulfide oxidoreductase YuxK